MHKHSSINAACAPLSNSPQQHESPPPICFYFRTHISNRSRNFKNFDLSIKNKNPRHKLALKRVRDMQSRAPVDWTGLARPSPKGARGAAAYPGGVSGEGAGPLAGQGGGVSRLRAHPPPTALGPSPPCRRRRADFCTANAEPTPAASPTTDFHRAI